MNSIAYFTVDLKTDYLSHPIESVCYYFMIGKRLDSTTLLSVARLIMLDSNKNSQKLQCKGTMFPSPNE